MKKVYFKGLSELRAIAALFVIFHHIELYKHRDGLLSLYDSFLNYFISHLGKNGVYIFFVLSGFLITYLLLFEKELKGKVDIKKFYLRRIFRIWPLYYLVVLLSFTLIPFLANNFTSFQNEVHYYDRILSLQESPYITLILFLLFLPNLALALKPAVVGLSQSWSVGVEEQFYILWPHIINKISNKKILFLLFLMICLIDVLIKLLLPLNIKIIQLISSIIGLIPIHFMAVGGIGALLLYYYKTKTENILSNKYIFFFITILLFIILTIDFEIPFKDLILAFVILFEILFIIQDKFKINIRSKYLEKIGDISYGVYMYHPFVMYVCFSFFNTTMPIENPMVYTFAVYSSIIILTLVISKLSFKYYESKFILLKNKKFTVIKSGKAISNEN